MTRPAVYKDIGLSSFAVFEVSLHRQTNRLIILGYVRVERGAFSSIETFVFLRRKWHCVASFENIREHVLPYLSRINMIGCLQ